jgi:hypothetical protein
LLSYKLKLALNNHGPASFFLKLLGEGGDWKVEPTSEVQGATRLTLGRIVHTLVIVYVVYGMEGETS